MSSDRASIGVMRYRLLELLMFRTLLVAGFAALLGSAASAAEPSPGAMAGHAMKGASMNGHAMKGESMKGHAMKGESMKGASPASAAP